MPEEGIRSSWIWITDLGAGNWTPAACPSPSCLSCLILPPPLHWVDCVVTVDNRMLSKVFQGWRKSLRESMTVNWGMFTRWSDQSFRAELAQGHKQSSGSRSHLERSPPIFVWHPILPLKHLGHMAFKYLTVVLCLPPTSQHWSSDHPGAPFSTLSQHTATTRWPHLLLFYSCSHQRPTS